VFLLLLLLSFSFPNALTSVYFVMLQTVNTFPVYRCSLVIISFIVASKLRGILSQWLTQVGGKIQSVVRPILQECS